ncbi:GntR family transcriptional regulator [Staphylococcus sp. IVB6246]|uniref:GntR family transcriptional regulator n=1 Tax=Staphylococcus sp. IVB6246 TaxID=2989772 RepID=UPI0021D2CF22|nr:GntR family transcriptional regulator [Staphylococcus sp. IVB6246]UXR69712.1 GntR family transcriptional regulator [Staphylococcus sp. IVB6246]
MMRKETPVYQQMRDDIINGILKPGEKITEVKMAEKYHVSRTPIREAIKQLEMEYLIKDGFIFIPNAEEFRKIFELRILLETHALKKAAIVFVQEDIDELRSYTNIDVEADENLVIETNDQFHKKLMSATHNEFIMETYEKMKGFIFLFSKTVINKRRHGLIDEHKEIVTALENREIDHAVHLLKTHLEKDLTFTLHYLDL